jgi:hypothetical protein
LRVDQQDLARILTPVDQGHPDVARIGDDVFVRYNKTVCLHDAPGPKRILNPSWTFKPLKEMVVEGNSSRRFGLVLHLLLGIDVYRNWCGLTNHGSVDEGDLCFAARRRSLGNSHEAQTLGQHHHKQKSTHSFASATVPCQSDP